MDYNTQRKALILPEYGRNIQQMVDYLLTIDDKAKRTEQANLVMEIMLQLSPQLKHMEEYGRKVWDHLHVMANFQLDIDGPYPVPKPEEIQNHPARIPYQSNRERSNHYGAVIQTMVEKLSTMDEGADRAELTRMLANQMKRSYLTWNKNSVEDVEILRDLERLSHGKLQLPEGMLLESIDAAAIIPSTQKRTSRKNGSGGTNSTSAGRRNKRRKKRV